MEVGKGIMISNKDAENIRRFYRAVLTLENEEECKRFFDDVATIRELLDLAARLKVAEMLSSGAVFSEISRETGASSATISRVNKCLNYGEGGYRTVLDRLDDQWAVEDGSRLLIGIMRNAGI